MVRSTVQRKLLSLICIFSINCFFVYGLKSTPVVTKKPPLSQYFKQIEGYEALQHIYLPDKSIAMLDLDDYTYVKFHGKHGPVYLYIGYYYTSDKAYAAHSPTACYPSHGWQVIGKPTSAKMFVGPNKINYKEIVTAIDKRKELVIYWYQASLFTNTQVYKNKIDMGYNKLFKNDEQHGFIRISVPFGDATYKENKESAIHFIQAFYPQFLAFVETKKT
jgi:EpsI family protein